MQFKLREASRPRAARWAALLLLACLAVFWHRTSPGPPGSVEAAMGSDPGSVTTAGLDPNDIVDVVPRDSIPALDEPTFISPHEATWLTDREPVIAVQHRGEARAYPLQIMTWHEIVNDTIGGTPVAVTFCPLCNTAIAFERPLIDGTPTTFGTSGKLINSNLLMYDRATRSLWPQVTGTALTGELNGQSLPRVPAQIVAWADFRSAHPDGSVLSRDTGFDRRYGENPYPGYDDVDRAPFLYSGEVDGRLAAVERVLGVSLADDHVAFPYFRLRENAAAGVGLGQDRVGGHPVVVFWKQGTTSALDRAEISISRDVGSAAAFSRRLDDKTLSFTIRDGVIVDRETQSTWSIFGRATSGVHDGRRLNPVRATDSFWFNWAAFHPDTRVWNR